MTSRSICDVGGIRVGHYTDLVGVTGCTAVLMDGGAVCGVDIRGSAPGTRETPLLDPTATVDRIHGLLLTGGSTFGLAAADGVVKYLEEGGLGASFRGLVIPIVPAAVLFDLEIGSPAARPDVAAGYDAAAAATSGPVVEGSVGAGTGATVGKVVGMQFASKGGLGSWCLDLPGGITVGALAAVNAFGDVYDEDGTVLAGCRQSRDGARVLARDLLLAGSRDTILDGSSNTTLGIVATNAVLDKAQATKLAQMAQSGFVRAIVPAHTTLDGDCVFAVATGTCPERYDLTVLGQVAADVMAIAVRRAVRAATPLGGVDVG